MQLIFKKVADADLKTLIIGCPCGSYNDRSDIENHLAEAFNRTTFGHAHWMLHCDACKQGMEEMFKRYKELRWGDVAKYWSQYMKK